MFDALLESMLDRVSNDIDKREGSIAYDMLAPVAMELSELYSLLEMMQNEGFADSASYHFLAKRAAERGIFPRPASHATFRARFNIEIDPGERFSLEQLNYEVIKRLDPEEEGVFEYLLQCEAAGREGNEHLGELIPVDYIEGLEFAELMELISPGEDEEEEEDLRLRYFAALKSQAFGGNVEDYIEKTMAIEGVGGVKVYPVWNGGGTVKLVVIGDNLKKLDTNDLEHVQELIDPSKDGSGLGIAPIGHTVTVDTVTETAIDIEATITYRSGYRFEDSQQEINAAIDSYFYEIAKEWTDSEEGLIVRISQLETRILNCANVIDIESTKVNGESKNLVLEKDCIPVRGEFIG